MSFDEAVKQIPSVIGCFKNGLQAMGAIVHLFAWVILENLMEV